MANALPFRKDTHGKAEEPNEFELNTIRNNKTKLADVRSRLSDISWWMRLLCQTIAQRANKEDGEIGKFWQSRYKAVRLLDETALIACSAYVDLNPIRAAMAQSLEESDHTSIQRRIESMSEKGIESKKHPKVSRSSTSKLRTPRPSRTDSFFHQ